MVTTISILLFLVFACLSAIHVYWGFGGEWGSQAVIPTKDDNIKPKMPGLVPTFIVALGLLALGIFVLNKAVLLNFFIPQGFNRYGLWTIAVLFILRAIGEFNYVGFFKKINDTKYYSPLCLIIAILAIIIELKK